MLDSLTLLSSGDPTQYPFDVPAIVSLRSLQFSASRICFFVGENGSGKSTLLEAIALKYGLSLQGGYRNFAFDADLSTDDTYPLCQALRLSFRPVRTGEGFFFRAETLFNLATKIDEIGVGKGYAEKPLHAHSHGETFLTVLEHKFRRSGLFLLDEPEAALSPQRQLSFLLLLHDTVREYSDAQFIISTHPPILLATPGAQILSFDDGHIHEIAYERPPPSHLRAVSWLTINRSCSNCCGRISHVWTLSWPVRQTPDRRGLSPRPAARGVHPPARVQCRPHHSEASLPLAWDHDESSPARFHRPARRSSALMRPK